MSAESFDFVLSSQIRLTILSFLSHNSCTPTQLSKTFQKHLSHVSRALKELENKDLVACSNPIDAKPRVYQLTNDGVRLLAEIYRYQARMKMA